MKINPRKKQWKYSDGGAAVFMILMIIVLMLEGLHALLRQDQGSPGQIIRSLLLLLLEIGLGTLGWFCGLKPLIFKGLWRSFRTWYEGFGGFGLLITLYGLLVLITGYAGSRYNSHPVPRSFSIHYFVFGAPFLIIAVVVFLIGKFKRKA